MKRHGITIGETRAVLKLPDDECTNTGIGSRSEVWRKEMETAVLRQGAVLRGDGR